MQKLMALMVFAVLTQAGCSTHGDVAVTRVKTGDSAISPATLASFQTGVTTLDQVEATLGRPIKSVRGESGNSVILYARVRVEKAGDAAPEAGSSLPGSHRVQYSTLLAFDPQGRFLSSWTRTDDLGGASPTTLGKFDMGNVLTSTTGMP
jgi:hypothetical protein